MKVVEGNCPECGSKLVPQEHGVLGYCNECHTLFGILERPVFDGYESIGGTHGMGKRYHVFIKPTCGKFYWRPVFMNCITARKGNPRIYRWGWWNFTWGETI